MSYKLFRIPISGDVEAEQEMNAFLRSHRVVSVDRRFLDQGENSCWCFCVDYIESRATASPSKKQRIDYREVLSPEQFSLYARLRDLRTQIAQEDSVPVYAVFTNEQLAQIVKSNVASKADLKQIAGVGDNRVEKYAERILSILITESSKNDEAGGKSVL